MEMPGGLCGIGPYPKVSSCFCAKGLAGGGWKAVSAWLSGCMMLPQDGGRDICVDAQVKQPVLHSTNRLFLLLFQLAVTRDTSKDAGDLHLGQLLLPSKAKGTIRHEVLRYF